MLVLIAGGASEILGGEYHPGQAWTTSSLNDQSSFAPAVTLTGDQAGVGLIRSNNNAGELRYITWSPGSFSTPFAVAAGVTTRAQPSVASLSGAVSAVFHGDDFKHYYAGYTSSWSPTAEAVGGTSAQSFGPSPATIAALSSGPILAFAGNDGDLYDQSRMGGTWQTANAHGLGNVLSQTPTIVALTSGPDLMIVFTRMSDSSILYTTRTGGTWTTPAVTNTNALTTGTIGVAALPSGAAVMAYRGLDGNAYWSLYTPGATPEWSPPAGIASTNVSVDTTPAVAQGIGSDTAEMAYLIGGVAYHARLVGSGWSPGVTVGGTALSGVAIAAAP